ncbi:hypothetical protein DFA_08005 [Cavenderia fasciculata]|uniref:Major facilitator superfamily (MFS) profile domain-containing protein n=1 Tax=Cavenderia fasciculata TaxID=261658 RepID=F4Q4L5_CACFS|nr:uncharacterized protein DFA_08005 [Cavenderia fasciculata]EGG17024.1 hypothetical protein DFA_08005 [Cavenderia fasciculata]|eukprot:XP_004355508.1 hypothetical protein DFA_08005 [Cavenderia fasciculata]
MTIQESEDIINNDDDETSQFQDLQIVDEDGIGGASYIITSDQHGDDSGDENGVSPKSLIKKKNQEIDNEEEQEQDNVPLKEEKSSMVKDFNLTSEEKTLGYYIGFLASTYYASQLFSSFFWGWFSNYKGRRPSVLIGLLGSMTYSTNQARAFSFIGLSWSIGGIVAPLIGGLFSNVCKQYPGLFDPDQEENIMSSSADSGSNQITSSSSIFCKFPYMLPNLMCVTFSIIGFVLAYFYLAESKTFTIKYSKSSLSLAKKYRQKAGGGTSSTNTSGVLGHIKQLSKRVRTLFRSTMGTFNLLDTKERGGNIQDEDGVDDDADLERADDLPQLGSSIEMQSDGEDEDLSENPRSVYELIKDKPVIYSCLVYALLGFMFTIFEEGFPVFAPITRTINPNTGEPEGGGYGFSSRDIGILQSTAGIFAFFIQTFVFPPIAKWLGLVKSFRLSLLIVLPAWIFLPELSRFTIAKVGSTVAQHPTIFWILLFPTYLMQSFASEISFITIIVMISNSALPKDMGLCNSIGMFLVSISRTFGPIIGSSLLAYTVSHDLFYPFDYHFLFVLLAVLAVMLFIVSFKLPFSLNYPKDIAIQMEEMGPNAKPPPLSAPVH